MRDAGGHRGRGLAKTIDWSLVICWLVLILIGWANIYASVHSSEPSSIFDWTSRSGKQFVWMATSLGIAVLILFIIPMQEYLRKPAENTAQAGRACLIAVLIPWL